MSAPVLVLGGTGKTGRRLVARLRAAGRPVRVAARRAAGPDAVRFAWEEADGWGDALAGAAAAYLVPPPQGGDASAAMIAFAEQALAAGVRRIVLLSASLIPAGGPGPGQVHACLAANAPEWAVLRPSWFMQNFSEGPHARTIREEDAVYSAAGDGRVGFVSADDIAACAAAALTCDAAPNADFVLTGPAALSYEEVAAHVSAVTGRTIAHRRLTAADLAGRHRAAGLPDVTATMLATMDGMIAAGAEDRTTPAVRDLTGRDPIAFPAFAQDATDAWRR